MPDTKGGQIGNPRTGQQQQGIDRLRKIRSTPHFNRKSYHLMTSFSTNVWLYDEELLPL